MNQQANQYPARLYSVGTGTGTGLTLNFPCMPDVLELSRESTYDVQSSPLHPDGIIHIYKSTSPMVVPITFKLHAQDDRYCNGPLDLLFVAAMLQAFTLPMAYGGTVGLNLTPASPDSNGFFALGSEAVFAGNQASSLAGGGVPPRYPPVCILDLVSTTNATGPEGPVNPVGPTGKQGSLGSQPSPGIRMVGYVRSASAKLMGPWLQVQGGGFGDRNLPSRAEFTFSFVHAPNYRNSFELSAAQAQTAIDNAAKQSGASSLAGAASIITGQAYSEFVRDYLYNAVLLAQQYNGPGQALVLGAIGTSTPAPVPLVSPNAPAA